jgi:hypothetical protein
MAIVRRIARYLGIAVLVVLCLIGAALVTTQTGWFKDYLRGVVERQAAQYLNGTLSIQRLQGSVLTGIELDGVALHHEGQTAVAIDKLFVAYEPITMIREGLILRSLRLEGPTVLLQRDNAGWNFNRFVKTRKNTGGKGAPPLTIETLSVSNGHVIVKDRGALVEDITSLNSTLRFAYHKPGIEFDIAQLSGRSPDVNIKKLAGNLRFEGGATQVGGLSVETDRSNFVTTFGWTGGTEPLARRTFDVTLHADRLSLPEVGLLFKPVAGINLAPALDVKAHGPFSALKMDVNVVSSEGNAYGPLIGHFGTPAPGLEGTLTVSKIDLQHLVNRPSGKRASRDRPPFDWTFGHPTAVGAGQPMKVNFKFAGPEAEGFGYRAENVRAQGVYVAPDLKFDATGNGYGAAASARATFHFPASGPMTYALAGNFSHLDMRRLPPSLAMPKLETVAAGQYQFSSTGRDWRGSGTLSESTVEGASFGAGTTFEIDSTNRELHYSGTGTVAGLNPQRFSAPLDISWLADERVRGLLTGSFTFDGSGRTVDSLVLSTSADLENSTMAVPAFPAAHVTMQMSNRTLDTSFAGSFEHLPGSLFVDKPALADSTLNGAADMRVTVVIPEVEPAKLEALSGTATLAPSTLAGLAVDKGQVDLTYANEVAEIRQLSLAGPSIEGTAKGTLAIGDTGQSDLQYDLAITDLGPVGKRFDQPLAGSAHVVGKATGPGSQLTFEGTVDANRFAYSTNVDALAAKATYTVTLPHMDVDQAKIQADTIATFATVGGMKLPRVTAKTTYVNHELTFDTSFEEETRSLAAAGRMVIHPDHNELHLQALNLKMGQTAWALAPGSEATAHYSPTALTVDNFVLERGAQRLTASGTVAIGTASATMPNDLTLRMDNVQVRDVNELMLGQRSLDGVLNATAEILGTRSDPRVQAGFYADQRQRGRSGVRIVQRKGVIRGEKRQPSTSGSSRIRQRSSRPSARCRCPAAPANGPAETRLISQ